MSEHDQLQAIDSKDLETTIGGADGATAGSILGGDRPGRPGPTFPRPFPFPVPGGEPGFPRPRPGSCMACGMG